MTLKAYSALQMVNPNLQFTAEASIIATHIHTFFLILFLFFFLTRKPQRRIEQQKKTCRSVSLFKYRLVRMIIFSSTHTHTCKMQHFTNKIITVFLFFEYFLNLNSSQNHLTHKSIINGIVILSSRAAKLLIKQNFINPSKKTTPLKT